jgi:hypothetical protein
MIQKLVIFLCLGAPMACVPFQPPRPQASQYRYWNFCHTSLAEQEAKFNSYSLSEQLETYLVCVQHFHPPETWLADYLARSGEAGARLIQSRLKVALDDPTIRDLIYVLRRMADLDYYDARIDPNLMRDIKAALNSMRNSELRKDGEADYAAIAERPVRK